MAVTMGFMFRVDGGYPPAVAVPPLQQGISPAPPIIEAERVVEPTSTARGNGSRNNMMGRSSYFQPDTSQQQPLTYSMKGMGNATLLSGRLLDTYA